QVKCSGFVLDGHGHTGLALRTLRIHLTRKALGAIIDTHKVERVAAQAALTARFYFVGQWLRRVLEGTAIPDVPLLRAIPFAVAVEVEVAVVVIGTGLTLKSALHTAIDVVRILGVARHQTTGAWHALHIVAHRRLRE